MAFNEQKLLTVLDDSINELEEKYDGYRGDVKQTIAQIIAYEREHLSSKTKVVKNIHEQVNKLGKLVNSKSHVEDSDGEQ